MAVKYVKDFAFDSGFGFTGSKGATPVRAYMRGGAVKKSMNEGSKKAGPKAPALAPAMVEQRSKGLGGLTPETKKLAAYNKPHMEGKKGAKVPQYAKGGAVKKHVKKPMAKMMKKAEGGPVAEIMPGDGMSPLQAMAMPMPEAKRNPGNDRTYVKPIWEKLGMTREAYLNQAGGPAVPTMPTGNSERLSPPPEMPPQLKQIGSPLSQIANAPSPVKPIDYSDMPMFVMGGGDEYWRKGGIKDQQAERARQWEISKGLRSPENLDYVGPAPRALDMIEVDDMIMTREDAERMKRPMPPTLGSIGGTKRDPMIMKPQSYDPGLANLKRRIAADSGMLPSPPAAAARMAPQDRRAMRADRREMARDIMDQYIAGPRRAMPAPRRAMPVAPRAPMVEPAMIRNPRMPVGGVATFAKGGKVSKGQAKVGKVMGEFKRGELHSGSKQGPLVTNPKQAKAIALSEARKAGAKIPKKAMGGRACG